MQKPKRAVSYRDYRIYRFRKSLLDIGMVMFFGSAGFSLLLVSLSAGEIILFALLPKQMAEEVLDLLEAVPNPEYSYRCLLIATIAGACSYLLYRFGKTAQTISTEMEPVVPVTRDNIDQLPAEETLVRASTEPTEEQEKILLRAAMAVEEVKPEELLRATTER